MRKRPKIGKAKAREMLRNPPHGRPLTEKQRGLFGAIASGQPLRGLRVTRRRGY
jgi:hypothetical protein